MKLEIFDLQGDENEVVNLLDTGQVGTLPLPSEQRQLVVQIAKFH
jgi:hypothetical protein